MPSLPLVIEVVDLIDEAGRRQHPLDAEAEAERLITRHPEADVSKEAVAEMIRGEEAAGIVPTSNRTS